MPVTPLFALSVLGVRLREVAILALIIKSDGVTKSVNKVAKARPKAIAVDSCCHHCVEGAPMATSLVTKSILTRATIGNKPKIVVAVVSSTGRNR